MGSSFGRVFKMATWGESHGPALGVVIEGCPAGIPLDIADIQRDLDRRRVGQSKVTSPRNERDQAEVLSGVFEGVTTGAPISLITYNREHGTTFVVIEHNMEFVMSLCTRVIVLAQGEIIAEGTPDEIRANQLVIDAYLGG